MIYMEAARGWIPTPGEILEGPIRFPTKTLAIVTDVNGEQVNIDDATKGWSKLANINDGDEVRIVLYPNALEMCVM